MIIYLIILTSSVGGIFIIALRHRQEIVNFNLALFMESSEKKFISFWYAHMHSQIFTLLEKQLRGVRIQVLKIENLLFRLTHGVRGISERNSNGNGNEHE